MRSEVVIAAHTFFVRSNSVTVARSMKQLRSMCAALVPAKRHRKTTTRTGRKADISMTPKAEPWLSQFCLEPQCRRRSLRRSPDACQDDECHSQDLAPENFCGGHGIGSCSLQLSQGGARVDARVFDSRGKAGAGSEAWAYQPIRFRSYIPPIRSTSGEPCCPGRPTGRHWAIKRRCRCRLHAAPMDR